MNKRFVCLVLLLLPGCTEAARASMTLEMTPQDENVWDGTILMRTSHAVEATSVSLVTWPELVEVGATRSDGSVGTVVEVQPQEVLGQRWYALRWDGSGVIDLPTPGVTTLAIPLNDGTFISRFWGSSGPYPLEVVYTAETGSIELLMSSTVTAASVRAALLVSQGPVSCVGVDEALRGTALRAECPAAFDPDASFRVAVTGISSELGEALPAVTLDVTLGELIGGIASMALPVPRTAPPVPSSLCADWACEM